MRQIIIATDRHHPSFGNQEQILVKIFAQHGYTVMKDRDYLSNKTRIHEADAFILKSPISSDLKYVLQLYMTHFGRRICYLTAEGPLDKSYYRSSLFKPYRVYANSAFTMKNLMASGIDNVQVVHHALDLELVKNAMDNPYPLPRGDGGETIFTYVGQIGVRKRADLMLEAFRLASKKTDYKVKLFTVSGISGMLTPSDTNIMELANFGSLNYYEVLRIIGGSDYYLHLSRSEGFGLPALEARSLGKPLVALDMQPTTEFIPRDGALWVPVHGTEQVKFSEYMRIIEHVYDVREASDIIIQAHDIRINYPSQYEDMRAKQLENIEEYDYRNKYKVFISD